MKKQAKVLSWEERRQLLDDIHHSLRREKEQEAREVEAEIKRWNDDEEKQTMIYAVYTPDPECGAGGRNYIEGTRNPAELLVEFYHVAEFDLGVYRRASADSGVTLRSQIERRSIHEDEVTARLEKLGYSGDTVDDFFVDWLCKRHGFKPVIIEYVEFPNEWSDLT